MRKFITHLFLFVLPILIILIVGLKLPTTNVAKQSIYMSSILKDSLLKHVDGPRIIFLGGSNLSFGLNSEMIKDSLQMNPINTGIAGSIGLIYMMNNYLKYSKSGDIVIIAPEYQQFCGNTAYGEYGNHLPRLIFDCNIGNFYDLNPRQKLRLIGKIPRYCLTKFRYSEYSKSRLKTIYRVDGFNEYGDMILHYNLKKKKFEPHQKFEPYNPAIIEEIVKFDAVLQKNNCQLYITFQGYQDISFYNMKTEINEIHQALKKSGLNVISTPEKFKMPDSLTYDTPGHLSKEGVQLRTNLFIQDFRKIK